MIAGGDNAIANKGLRENFRLGHARYLNPSPAGKRAAAIARNLKSQQPDFAFLYAVIVRLRGAHLAVKQKTEQALLVDETVTCVVQIKGKVSLTPVDGQQTVNTVHMDVKAAIPIFGSKLEELVETDLKKNIQGEVDFAKSWMRSHGY